MHLLLDTQVFLWAIHSPHLLSHRAQSLLLDSQNSLMLSAASYWEICIKYSLGKLDLATNWTELFEQEMAINQIRWLPIEPIHCQKLVHLPFIHRDPFDRLLVAQAQSENLVLLTADAQLANYPVSMVW